MHIENSPRGETAARAASGNDDIMPARPRVDPKVAASPGMGDDQSHGPSIRVTPREHPAWLRGVYAAVFLYLFLCAINVMGSGLNTMAGAPPTSDWIDWMFSGAARAAAALVDHWNRAG